MFFLLPSGLTGHEPATSAVTGRCSNQLNYSPLFLHTSVPYSRNFGNFFLCQPTSPLAHTQRAQPRGSKKSVKAGHKG